MTIEENRIILQYYAFPFSLNFDSIMLINDGHLKINYNDEPLKIKYYRVWNYDYTKSLFHKFFPKLFRKYAPGSFYELNFHFLFSPQSVRGMHFIFDDNLFGFGTLLSWRDYDEILTLILAQRKKWEEEHPENKSLEVETDDEEAEDFKVKIQEISKDTKAEMEDVLENKNFFL
jgi:hypothetical protein